MFLEVFWVILKCFGRILARNQWKFIENQWKSMEFQWKSLESYKKTFLDKLFSSLYWFVSLFQRSKRLFCWILDDFGVFLSVFGAFGEDFGEKFMKIQSKARQQQCRWRHCCCSRVRKIKCDGNGKSGGREGWILFSATWRSEQERHQVRNNCSGAARVRNLHMLCLSWQHHSRLCLRLAITVNL